MPDKTDGDLVVECIEALCNLSIEASSLARTAYEGAYRLAEKLSPE